MMASFAVRRKSFVAFRGFEISCGLLYPRRYPTSITLVRRKGKSFYRLNLVGRSRRKFRHEASWVRPRLLGPAMYHPALDDATVRPGCEPLAQIPAGGTRRTAGATDRDLSKRQELGGNWGYPEG